MQKEIYKGHISYVKKNSSEQKTENNLIIINKENKFASKQKVSPSELGQVINYNSKNIIKKISKVSYYVIIFFFNQL